MNKKINAVENEVVRDVRNMMYLSISCLYLYYEDTIKYLVSYFKKYNKMDALCTEILRKNALDWNLYEIREFELDASIDDCLEYSDKIGNLGYVLDLAIRDNVKFREDLYLMYGYEVVEDVYEVAYILMEISRCIQGLAINCRMYEPFTDRTIYDIMYN
jgi:hypothetical protein